MVTIKPITIADEVWIATALLHREQPERADFTIREIRERVIAERLAGVVRPGILPHIYHHCVANYPPNPATLCILLATSKSTRRLWRPGDPCHPDRTKGRQRPDVEVIPLRYRDLPAWYRTEYAAQGSTSSQTDPILALRGLGKGYLGDEHPDDYVRRLREGWE